MTTYLLDTNSLIDDVYPAEGEVAVSVLTFAELITGIRAADDPARRADRQARYDRLARSLEPIPVTASVLHAYKDLDQVEVEAGRKPRKRRVDLLVAATARANGWTVWTSNRADFAGLEDLVAIHEPGRRNRPS